MQSSLERKRSRPGAGLAGELDAHWTELARFMTSHRLRSTVYTGAMRDISAAQIQALIVLAESDLRMSELAARLGLAESTVTRLVDRLEATKLVRRRASEPDRRCVVAELTPSGRRVAGELEDSRRQFLTEILATLQPEERKQLIGLFAKVTAALRGREPNGEGS
jgi:DNA-binding MarR family transcriptional regulator